MLGRKDKFDCRWKDQYFFSLSDSGPLPRWRGGVGLYNSIVRVISFYHNMWRKVKPNFNNNQPGSFFLWCRFWPNIQPEKPSKGWILTLSITIHNSSQHNVWSFLYQQQLILFLALLNASDFKICLGKEVWTAGGNSILWNVVHIVVLNLYDYDSTGAIVLVTQEAGTFVQLRPDLSIFDY